MPNARKKKAAKNEDFKKKKLKVGKKKALPDNYTDTSFKSKSIILPNQSINEDKSHEITTSRNLTLSDLVVQLKHYNSGVKKEALSGLLELCNSHPELLVSSLGQVVNGVLKLFIDDDREVRKATYNFLKETFIDIDRVELQPFMPLLIIYTCSAMTHIFEDIRLDAVKLMNLWIQIAPDIVVTKFWGRVTGNYMSLLTVDSNNMNTSGGSTNSIVSTSGTTPITTASMKAAVNKSHLHIHKNKLSLLTSLSNFLEAGLSEQSRHDPFWFFLNYLDNNKHTKDAFRHRMSQYCSVDNQQIVEWKEHKAKIGFIPIHSMVNTMAPYLSKSAEFATFSHLHLFDNTNTTNQSNMSTNEAIDLQHKEFSTEERLSHIKHLIETFQPILVASWLEAAPSVFMSVSTISFTPALELLYEILKLSLVLWRAMIGSEKIKTLSKEWLHHHLQTLLKHFTVYFPFGADSFGNRGAKVDEVLQSMNIMLCELTSLFLLAKAMQRTHTNNTQQRSGNKRRKLVQEEEEEDDDEFNLPDWAERVVDHVLGVLGLDDAEGDKNRLSSSFKTENLISLLPAIWGFLNCLSYEESISMFKATLGYFHFCQPTSSSKRVLLDFIIRIYLIQSTPSYNGQFTITKHSELANILTDWVGSLPKMLWQIRSNHVETSRTILNILCDIVKRGDKDLFELSTLLEVETKLVPFFFVNLAKGPLYGPFNDLPADVQQRALDYVFYLNSGSEKMASAIEQCKKQQDITVKL
ncbi:uncharacterized protein BX663DRAFT_484579 [Cokeromyces recurvatus]|uniref:uncharacterized protein n=1 Tax=Cokeromyces recurvatus TaxID=90255 RepID=UPI00221FFAB2|nr:uncharacterized protein BX663DRAFT_484579 [Cokeromyces recurvatus]KAI7905295.1 hypothetical protein BX663DRAFT_484579 [Cokeromyces recurvatus]